MMESQLIVNLEQAKAYRGAKCVLDIGSLRITKSELLSIIGPNGSGKSTLLQVINGLLPVREGAVSVMGIKLPSTNPVELRRRSAMVFQDPLFIHDTVYANVALPLRFRGLDHKTIVARVEAAMTAFRCSHLRDRLAHRLSGGEAQRVCLARSFVTEPELLLLDEPFSALDPSTRNDLLAELKHVALVRQVTVLLVSHNLDEVLRFAQRAIVMEGGKVAQDASPETVLRRPVNMTIARLTGMDNIWPCQIHRQDDGQSQVVIQEGISFTCEQMGQEGVAWCCLPGDSFVTGNHQTSDASWVQMSVVITDIIPGIGVVQVEGRTGNLPVIIRMAGDKAVNLQRGQLLTVAFRRAAAHIVIA